MNITVYDRAVNLEFVAWYTSVLIDHFFLGCLIYCFIAPLFFHLFPTCFTQATYLLFPKYKKLFLKSEPVPSTLRQSRDQDSRSACPPWHQGLALLIGSAQ